MTTAPGTGQAAAGTGQAAASTVTAGSAYQNVTVPPAQQAQGTTASASTTAPATETAADTSQNDIQAFFSSGGGPVNSYTSQAIAPAATAAAGTPATSTPAGTSSS